MHVSPKTLSESDIACFLKGGQGSSASSERDSVSYPEEDFTLNELNNLKYDAL